MVVGDFNGAAWRPQTKNGNLSIIEEAFADSDLPMPPGATPLWGQGQYQVNGLTFAGFSSPRTPMNAGKYVSMVHSPFLTTLWASVPKIKAATTKWGCTWLSLTITVTANVELIEMCQHSGKPECSHCLSCSPTGQMCCACGTLLYMKQSDPLRNQCINVTKITVEGDESTQHHFHVRQRAKTW